MAKQDFLTDQQVEAEIARLVASENVQLAKLEERIKYKRRQYMYKLRTLEKRGRELTKLGYDLDNLEEAIESGEVV